MVLQPDCEKIVKERLLFFFIYLEMNTFVVDGTQKSYDNEQMRCMEFQTMCWFLKGKNATSFTYE